eukprot:409320_1
MSEIPLSLSQTEMLIDGYCKMDAYNFNVPIMLIRLIVAFYNEIYHWTFKCDKIIELNQFLSAPHKEYVIGNPIKIRNITFQFSIYAREYNKVHRAYFAVKPLLMPDNIAYVAAIITFYNKQCNYFNTVTYTFKNCNKRIGFYIADPSIFKDIQEVNFCGKLEILRIEPNNLKVNKSLLYHKQKK